MLRLRGEGSPAWRRRIRRELEPILGAGAYAVVETLSAVRAWLRATDAAAPTSAPDPLPRRDVAAPGDVGAPATLSESLASLGSTLEAGILLLHLPSRCHALAQSAEAAGARLTAFLFARLARDAGARSDPSPIYAYEMARLATAIPELAVLGREWLTWAALEGRRMARWDVAALAVATLADHVGADGDEATADRLRRVAEWAEARARGQARPPQ
ncbi:MAG: hypothetical protein ABW277_23075 [Longimicrobiaceae bacterium]